MQHWHFIRHGQSTANAEGWLAGQQDVALTDKGRAEAQALGELLAARGGVQLHQVWSSDLIRARETAEILLATPGALHLPDGEALRISPDLRERDAGDWTHLLRDKLPRSEINKMRAWNFAPPGGESMADMAARVLPRLASIARASAELAAPELGSTLIVSHGGLMRVMIGLLDAIPTHEIGVLAYGNCELVTRRGMWSA